MMLDAPDCSTMRLRWQQLVAMRPTDARQCSVFLAHMNTFLRYKPTEQCQIDPHDVFPTIQHCSLVWHPTFDPHTSTDPKFAQKRII